MNRCVTEIELFRLVASVHSISRVYFVFTFRCSGCCSTMTIVNSVVLRAKCQLKRIYLHITRIAENRSKWCSGNGRNFLLFQSLFQEVLRSNYEISEIEYLCHFVGWTECALSLSLAPESALDCRSYKMKSTSIHDSVHRLSDSSDSMCSDFDVRMINWSQRRIEIVRSFYDVATDCSRLINYAWVTEKKWMLQSNIQVVNGTYRWFQHGHVLQTQ